MAQTEEFMFQNVAYRPTVYKTGIKPIHLLDQENFELVQQRICFCACLKICVAQNIFSVLKLGIIQMNRILEI